MLRKTPGIVAASCLLAGAITLVLAGPLDPPAGPVAPTYKTLSEVEARIAINATNTPGDADSVHRIAAPGSYYLIGALTIPSGKNGIEIAATNVTVDLNGFRLVGQSGSLDGIHVNGAPFGITIRNGVIFTVSGDGVDAATGSAVRVEGLTVLSSTGQGIVVGVASEVAHCAVLSNGSHGINTGDACRVTDCTARGNGGIGIDVDGDSLVRDSIAVFNDSDGISGGDGCTVTGCTAGNNTVNGINTAGACIVSGSVGRANGNVGIDVDSIGVIRDCAARDNLGNGITANNGCVLTACASGVNATGVVGDQGASISGCNAYANEVHGILFGSYSDVRANNAALNAAGSGLITDGNHSRVDANYSAANYVGVTANGHSNFIGRNMLEVNGYEYFGADDDYWHNLNLEPWVNW